MFPPMREQSNFKPKEGILGRLELRKTSSADNDKSLLARFELFDSFGTGNSALLCVSVILIALLPVFIWSTKSSLICVNSII